MVREIVFVAVGGALGALVRFGTASLATRWWGTAFPWGILIVNVAGCFLMGIVIKVMFGLEAQHADVRPQLIFWQRAVAVGFLGGLTTFSSFSADTVLAIADNRLGTAAANVAANVLLCLGAVWLGMALAAGVGK